MGAEPTLSAWKAGVLPLNYIRIGYAYNYIIKEINYKFFLKNMWLSSKNFSTIIKRKFPD